MQHCFLPADILLPAEADLSKWAVIACDQFTSDIAYWKRVRQTAGDALSAVNMILPEAELPQATEQTIAAINRNMTEALEANAFACHEQSFIYVERTLQDGSVRQGIVGVVDLEEYDFHPGTRARIRATEQTVTERIPPRAAIRRNALVEFSHVILFCDDPDCTLIEEVGNAKDRMTGVYDFSLMEGGGQIRGWRLSEEVSAQFCAALEKYVQSCGDEAAFLVADGNHSLATAKQCYEDLKKTLPEEVWREHPARYAMVELENIHSPVISFQPIHRILTQIQPAHLRSALESTQGQCRYSVHWVAGEEEGTTHVSSSAGQLQIAALQPVLDAYLRENPGQIDYIHDDDALRSLAAGPNRMGLLLDGMDKGQLFAFIAAGNTLPRKTFSLGHAVEKRYYLEGRKIR